MKDFPYWPLAGFYFFYFSYLGAFAPYFSLYLVAIGFTAAQIGVLMALPQVTRIFAPHLWGWLADVSDTRLAIVRWGGVAGAACYLGVFFGTGVAWLFAVILAVSFFWSAALPLVEATTLSHLGEQTARYGRVRVWGSLGFIAAVVVTGYVLDALPIASLLWVILGLLLGILACSWRIPEAPGTPHGADHAPIADILRRPEVIAFIVACALMAVAHGPYYTFYSLHLVNHGYATGAVGWLWALGVVSEIAIFVWMPHLYRAFTLRQILIASFAAAALRFTVIGWMVDSVLALTLAQPLHAATFGSFHAAAVGVIHRLFRGRHQARGQTIYGSLTFGLGGTLGGLYSGYAWDRFGAEATFSIAALCAVAGMLLLIWKLRFEAR